MSRQAPLPPRCPFQKRSISRQISDPISLTTHAESNLRHQKSSSQSSVQEEQLAWLDDLLDDQDVNGVGKFHRRSASDSVTLLDGILDAFPSLNTSKDKENAVADESSGGLQSNCMYGPNSPRKRNNLTFSENALVSALSESASESPLQYVDDSLCMSGVHFPEIKADLCASTGEINADNKTSKRLESDFIYLFI